MKFKKAIIPIILAILTIAGCGDKNTEKVDNTDYTEANKICYYSAPGMFVSPGENGAFFLKSGYINYYDKDMNDTMYLCNKAECTHDTEECNAYTDGHYNFISYNGKLYFIQCKDAIASLCCSELDGSSREELSDLFYYRIMGGSTEMVINSGYAYIVVRSITNGEYYSDVYKVKLEKGAEPVTIFSNEEDVKETHIGICTYTPEYMLFERESYVDGVRLYELFIYNTETDEVTKVPYEECPGALIDDNLYISNGVDIVKYNIEGKTEEVVIPGAGKKVVFYDGQYLYLDNVYETYSENENLSEMRLYVYNLDYEKIDEIDVGRGNENGAGIVYGGGDELWVTYNQGDNSYLGYYEKSEFGTGEHELHVANNVNLY